MEQCVKCALPGRLAPDWSPILRSILIDNLERQICSTSEIIVRGSLLVNDVLLHCLRLHLPIPTLTQSFFNACFIQGLKKTSHASKKFYFTIVKDVYENEFHEYPFIERTRGDMQAMVTERPPPPPPPPPSCSSPPQAREQKGNTVVLSRQGHLPLPNARI